MVPQQVVTALGELVCHGTGHLLEEVKNQLEGGEQTRSYEVWRSSQGQAAGRCRTGTGTPVASCEAHGLPLCPLLGAGQPE